MRTPFIISFLFCCFVTVLTAQEPEPYRFEQVKENACSAVKDQKNTGTCWAFAGSSLMESELMRLGKSSPDISEMYIVRSIYKDKADNYIRRQGKANLSQGGLAHDAFRAAAKHGLMPQDAYQGKQGYDYNHSAIETELKALCDSIIETGRSGKAIGWQARVDAYLDRTFGVLPATFAVDGRPYSAESYHNQIGLRPDDYVTLTSFTHQPMYSGFVLEIPDNWSNGVHYNVPLNDLMRAINFSLQSGYTIAWDADVSNKGFAPKHAIAIVPSIDWEQKNDAQKKNSYKYWEPQKLVTAEMRQQLFDAQETQDDHLMHIVALASEANTKDIYYKVKNSWGEITDLKGYFYASEAYLRLNTIGVTMNKNAVPQDLRRRLGLEAGTVTVEGGKASIPEKQKLMPRAEPQPQPKQNKKKD
jgi:bleomycin hydrolase